MGTLQTDVTAVLLGVGEVYIINSSEVLNLEYPGTFFLSSI